MSAINWAKQTFADSIVLNPTTTPGSAPATGVQVYAKADGKLYTLSAATGTETSVGSGGSVVQVTQASHGFVAADVGRPLYLNSSTYTLAKADLEATAEVAGLISKIIDTNIFEVCLSGEIAAVGANTLEGGGSLVPGTVYFLSATSAGKISAAAPSIVGQISKPLGIARTTAALDFFNMRGSAIGGSNVYTQISLANNTTTTIQNAVAYDSVELAGWMYINATAKYRFHFKAQVTKKGDATDYLISYQTSGDTPPTGFNISVTTGGLVQVTLPSMSGFTSAIAQFSLNGPAVGVSLPLQIESTNVSFSTVQAKDTSGIAVKSSTGTNLITATGTQIETLPGLKLTGGMSDAYSVELSGTYNANTYYPIANSSNMPAGVYMLFIYQSTYNSSPVYQFTWSYGPAYMFGYATNSSESVAITFISGSGHARNGVNAPLAQIRGTPNADGKQYVDISFPATLPSLNGADGSRVRVYFKRIA